MFFGEDNLSPAMCYLCMPLCDVGAFFVDQFVDVIVVDL
ncbi:Uncharacterised protein [Dermatophilus congolensis]|uniref:Uncharacterized protein n=1 Tax=Dermatophilus congolensis TaxID=1863 RepID=A0AA46GZX2_9MICO|nr:Uncharacterised protein [Dermatophilus congolensis]